MDFPTIKVEAAFAVGTTSAFILDDPVKGVLGTATLSNEIWVDITEYARNITSRRGANRGEGPVLRFEAGTFTIELDNSDRRFDPTNTSGPYVAAGRSQVEPMREIRVTAEYRGTSYPVCTGYADQWDVSYSGPSVSTCILTATDATKILSNFDRVALETGVGAGELSGVRVHRVLNSVNWPIGKRSIDSGNTALQATTMDRSAWEELLKVQDTEIGQVFIDARGYVVFRERQANMTSPESTEVQAGFGDGVGELPFLDTKIAYDDTTLINLARIGRVGGIQQTAEDLTSQQQYLTHTYDRTDLIHQTDEESADYAAFVLYQCKDPELRFTDLSLAGNEDDELFDHMLGREIGDLITVTRRPPGDGPVTTRQCFIVGIQHSVPGPNQWVTTFALQSATKWSFFTLDNGTLGTLDQNLIAF